MKAKKYNLEVVLRDALKSTSNLNKLKDEIKDCIVDLSNDPKDEYLQNKLWKLREDAETEKANLIYDLSNLNKVTEIGIDEILQKPS